MSVIVFKAAFHQKIQVYSTDTDSLQVRLSIEASVRLEHAMFLQSAGL